MVMVMVVVGVVVQMGLVATSLFHPLGVRDSRGQRGLGLQDGQDCSKPVQSVQETEVLSRHPLTSDTGQHATCDI